LFLRVLGRRFHCNINTSVELGVRVRLTSTRTSSDWLSTEDFFRTSIKYALIAE